ncbi:TniQ protein [Burkholderia sp. D7]|nr:TniQ protein [Burkholderia sp. D7]
MNLSRQPHPGLPVVPHAVAEELLGSWLLRIARLYGLSLRDFLVQLAVLSPTKRPPAAWYELRQEHLFIDRLAFALHQPSGSIIAMLAPHCDRRWPTELGFCRKCLDDAAAAGTSPSWLRRWSHPLSVACARHRIWLEPVTTRRLREISTVGDIADLPPYPSQNAARQLQRELALIDSALWLEALVIDSPQHHPPWGKTDVGQLTKILRRLVQILMSPAAADMVRHQLGRWNPPERRQRWACQTFRVDDGANGILSFAAPDYLRHRQFVLGLLGYYLRLVPANRAPLHELTTLIAREIPISQLARWPAAAVGWVSPASNLSPRPRSVPRERQRSRKPVRPPPLFST